MSGVYEHVCTRLKLTLDVGMLKTMKEVNAAKIAELDAKVQDAETNLGETDVRDALLAKAQYLMDVGNREEAATIFEAAEAKGSSSGMKLDTVFSKIRLAILYEDWVGIKALVTRGKTLCELGGDWERKNKLKVYEGLLAMATRDLSHAANMFLDSIATFTAHELFDYTTCVFYAVVTAMVTLNRVDLRAKVVDSPEVLQVI